MEKLLTMEDVIEIGVGKRTTIWKKVKTGEFPKPIRLGNSHSSPLRWREEDIKKYIDGLVNIYGL
jgi:prophage regulatory protein|tara:strand:+ start:202 stop:396 length:195 start_codon:yes stop_codon:yes gene_type:complete